LQPFKKNDIPDIQKENITAVCIDDFSFKKRHTYGTLMVNIETHCIIDIIDSRELEPVTEWLKTFPALQFVSRDGSITFNRAITKANENIEQISDRFHLLQGLTDAAKKFISGYFKANIGLPVSASHYNGTETSNYWAKDMGCTDFPTREHLSSVERKKKLLEEARTLQNEGYNPSKIAERIGVTLSTVKRYLKPNFNPENAGYNTTGPSKIKPYADDIKDMLSKEQPFKKIESFIREKGYDGAASTIRMFATRERKLMKEAGATEGNAQKIERKWLVSLLYKPIDQVKKISQEQLDTIINQNPVIGMIYDAVKGFKEVLFSKKEEELDNWIKYAEQLGIDEINSFIGGIKRDITAVKNAIKLDFNNGLAEGSVNKLKVIKRIMYGRCGFDLLKNKTLKLELKKIN
jgi:predicted transcriptional regulator